MATVTVYVASDEFTAISLRDMLAQQGIPCVLQTNEVPGYGMLLPSLSRTGWGEILVKEEDYERAAELIAGCLGTLGELAEAEDRDKG